MDYHLLPNASQHPILFEEIYYKSGTRPFEATVFRDSGSRFRLSQLPGPKDVDISINTSMMMKGESSPVSEEEKSPGGMKGREQSFYNPDFIVERIESRAVINRMSSLKRSLMMPSILKPPKTIIHLIFLVHGLEGKPNDMRLLKNSISLFYPDVHCHIIASLEKHTQLSIPFQGDLLAEEVVQVIRDNQFPLEDFRISFIGHSLGGIVTRAALPKLERYSKNMCSYISLGSPHLGCRNNKSKIVEMALWVVKKIRNQEALNQLCFSDHEEIEKTFMFNLSKAKGLEWFKHMALCSSYQDTFSPYESSRVQIGDKLSRSTKEIKNFQTMANNILSRLRINKLYRMDIDFEIKK